MFEHVPLLQTQRDLLDLPRGFGRFRGYLRAITGGTDDAELLPLAAFNPMSRGHVTDRLDELLALDAEAVVAGTLDAIASELAPIEGRYRVGLGLADDVAGGWTDRLLVETHGLCKVPRSALKRGWLPVILYVSDPAKPEVVRGAVRSQVYRSLYLARFGAPTSLGAILRQEGLVARFAGLAGPELEPDDATYSETVLEPYLDSGDFAIQFPALHGDRAAIARGYRPLGLSEGAGLALARILADRRALDPIAAFVRHVPA